MQGRVWLSSLQRFSAAFASGSLVGILALGFETLVRPESPAAPANFLAYALGAGLAAGLASLGLGLFIPAGAATASAVLTLAGFLALHVLYYVNVRLLAGEPYLAWRSLAVDAALVGAALLVTWMILRSPRVFRVRKRFGTPVAVAGAVLLVAEVGLHVWIEAGHARDVERRGEGPSVVLLVLDSVRRDHLGLYGYARPTSPNLDALAREARVYESAWSASSWTVPSVRRLLHGSVDGTAAPGEALSERLRARGYVTACFSDNLHLAEDAPILRGFDRVERSVGEWRRPFRHTLVGEFLERGSGGSDRRLVDRALAWVERAKGPFFLYVHLMESHTPFDEPPIDGRRRAGRQIEYPMTGMHITPAEREDIVARYDGGIREVDAQAGRLLAALRGAGRPVVALITSDHGESLGEDDRWFHGRTLAPELVRVPLLVIGDGVRPGRVTEAVDYGSVADTVLAVAGGPCAGCGARDLRSSEGDRLAAGRLPPGLAYRVARGHRLLVDFDTGRRQLFDLAADPDERHDVSGSDPALTAALAATLPRTAPAGAPDEEGLRALGYLGLR
jgi:arylsulfatase A-like enzyme